MIVFNKRGCRFLGLISYKPWSLLEKCWDIAFISDFIKYPHKINVNNWYNIQKIFTFILIHMYIYIYIYIFYIYVSYIASSKYVGYHDNGETHTNVNMPIAIHTLLILQTSVIFHIPFTIHWQPKQCLWAIGDDTIEQCILFSPSYILTPPQITTSLESWQGWVIISILKRGMKLLINFQTSTEAPLKFGNVSVISSSTLLDMWLPIHAGVEVNPR